MSKHKMAGIKFMMLSILISVFAIPFISAETMCEFDFFIYKNDIVEFIKARSYIGNPESAELKSSDYGLVFVDASGKPIEQTNLPVIFYVLDPMEEVDSIPLLVRKPCSNNWNELQIYHNNEKIFSIFVKGLLCNSDNICNNYETILTCPNDCPSGSKDGWCDKKADSICDPDCIIGAGDPDCESKTAALAESKDAIPIYCNNNLICEIYENEVNCPSDCKKKAIAKQETKTPQIVEKRLITGKIEKGGENKYLIVSLALILILIILIIGLFKMKRK